MTVVTVHSRVISRVKSLVLSVPAGLLRSVSELSSKELSPSWDLVGLFQTPLLSPERVLDLDLGGYPPLILEGCGRVEQASC